MVKDGTAERHGRGVSPGGRPLDYRGSEGWTSRIISKSLAAGAQEISRELRASKPEHWVDCALGGLASGALLGHFQGGRSRALPMGILFASVGTGLQLVAIQYREYRIRHFLSTLPSESLTAESHTEVPAVVEQKSSEDNSWRTPDWFPIQMLSAEEAAKRALEQERKRQQALKNLRIGESPLKQQSS